MSDNSNGFREETIGKLVAAKLKKLATWEMPEIGHCIGPDERSEFEFFSKRLQLLKASLREHLAGLDDQDLAKLICAADTEQVSASIEAWETLELESLRKLWKYTPPPIKAGFGHEQFRADFEHWGQTPSYSLNEAVTLSLGVEPDKIDDDEIDALLREKRETLWPAYKFLLKRREQFTRFFHFGGFGYAHMTARELNAIFDKLGTDVHPEFKAQLDSRWPSEKSKLVISPDNFSSQEKRTLLKLLAAMACEQYSFDPHAKRSEAVSRIRDDLEFIGESMDTKTIRKWLLEAMEFVDDEYWKKQS
ncbi:hypothetical protein [Planktotalea arctica]|uniref:hypothetical protein n=1 Tax=Planktotalea arctica TaxID=1481893 RepID=UPI000A175F39|nr:hypothetical protein [Planktotalea arctica]